MVASIRQLMLPGPMLERGFWLYVWKITSPIGELLYVGRTGDSSSSKASQPFARMGQHLGNNPQQNMVRRHLEKREVSPEACKSFKLIAYGPLFCEATDWSTHVERRNVVGALEKALAEALKSAGYDVLNSVRDRHSLDEGLWEEACKEFACHFPGLRP